LHGAGERQGERMVKGKVAARRVSEQLLLEIKALLNC